MLQVRTKESRRPKARAEELGEPRLGRRDSYGVFFCGWGRGCTYIPHYMESYACGSKDIAKAPYPPLPIDPINYQARYWKKR